MDDFKTDSNTTDSQPVVNMQHRRRAAHFAPLEQIESYWDALRGTRPMPLRSEIDPRGLKGALEYCFVLERIAPGLARLRVAGSHLGDLMGMEVRGMPISSFLSPDSRQQFGESMEEVFETPATANILLKAETSFGRPAMEARMVLLPVRSDLGDTSRILGGLVTRGDIGRVPRRFKVDMIKINPITRTAAPEDPNLAALRNNFKATTSRKERDKQPASFNAPRRSEVVMAAEDGTDYRQVLPGVPYLRVVK